MSFELDKYELRRGSELIVQSFGLDKECLQVELQEARIAHIRES